MVLYCLAFGQFPFIPEQRFEALLNGQEHPKLIWPDRIPSFPNAISKTLKDLVEKMIEVDPDARITMEEVADHPWLVGEKNETQPTPTQMHSLSSIQDSINVC